LFDGVGKLHDDEMAGWVEVILARLVHHAEESLPSGPSSGRTRYTFRTSRSSQPSFEIQIANCGFFRFLAIGLMQSLLSDPAP
jgi:hypothetical protein